MKPAVAADLSFALNQNQQSHEKNCAHFWTRAWHRPLH